MKPGAYTAVITPFDDDFTLSKNGFKELIDFQIKEGITGILSVGTTGESATLTKKEHKLMISLGFLYTENKCIHIAGAGSNNTQEAFEFVAYAQDRKCDGALLVDPYYNGPSSLEIRKEYYELLAEYFPHIEIIPYIIPGRTGCELNYLDLSRLYQRFDNIKSIKAATGDLSDFIRYRKACGNDLIIFSGDDSLTAETMASPSISANGVISVISNVAPKAVSEMADCFIKGQDYFANGFKIAEKLKPLFDLVTIKQTLPGEYGEILQRFRNPLPIKTLMRVLGMPSGPCRRPLGLLNQDAFMRLITTVKKLHEQHPEILEPIQISFGTNIFERLSNPVYWKGCYYK